MKMHFEDEPTIYDDLPQPPEATNALARRVIGIAIDVHRELGPGLPEDAYERALAMEFDAHHISYSRQHRVSVEYKGIVVCVVKLDFVIESILVLEIKSVQSLSPIERRQVMRYLHVLKLPLGLLMNFNVMVLKEGVNRVFRREPVI